MRIVPARPLRLAAALALAASLGHAQTPQAPEEPEEETAAEAWTYAASLYGYFIPGGPYGQPTVTADRGWFHTEVRYNYEARDTASIWLSETPSAPIARRTASARFWPRARLYSVPPRSSVLPWIRTLRPVFLVR